MNKKKVSQIISEIDERYLEEAAAFAVGNKEDEPNPCAAVPEKTERQPRRIKWAAVAACLAVVLLIGSVTYAVAAEAKEYKMALAFFEENGLSTEGLSRSEIKEVYRDIKTNSFSCEKTAEVLQQTVPGWEIAQDEPTPEELTAPWDKNVWKKTVSREGIGYRIEYEYTQGQEWVKKSVLACYQDGTLLWTAEFPNVYAEGYARAGEETVLWGWVESSPSAERRPGWIACVDAAGTILWKRGLRSHGFQEESVASILSNGDGTWAVISRGDLRYLCLSCCDADGKELSFHQTEVGNLGIRNAARLGDGYIVQLGNTIAGVNALLFKMDREGNVVDSFSYEADDCEYYLTDMAEYEGQVYLSAYATPKQQDAGGRHEIANVLNYIFSNENWEITGEELTPVVRDNYTAVLLLCDPEGGVPKTFYSVKGSLGGQLSIRESGELAWDVERITTTFFSPATNAFTIGGSCSVFRYTFDAAGGLTGQTDTGETVPYRR